MTECCDYLRGVAEDDTTLSEVFVPPSAENKPHSKVEFRDRHFSTCDLPVQQTLQNYSTELYKGAVLCK